ncbi:MAG: DNA recombination protein RmuC [bacterium]
MQVFLLTIVSMLLVATLFALYLVHKKLSKPDKTDEKDGAFMMLQNQMQEINKTLSDTQTNINKTIQEQFNASSRVIQGITGQSHKMIVDITEKLTSLDKTNQQVIGFSEQLNNLEKVLTSQKNRGNLGEAGLQLVLENILPPGAYELQYQFEDGDIVDAVVKTKDGLIPVDSKFSLTNYTRILEEKDKNKKSELEKEFKNDLKKRIDETAKYIKPKLNTMDFAFMFIPAEAIYYDLLVNEVGAVKVNTRSLIDYAFNERKVIIVSPTTFAAYLQTVLQGLRAFKIEESAKSIRKNVEKLGKHMRSYEDFMKKLGTSMGTTVNHYNSAYKELNKIDKDVVRITEGDPTIEPLQLDKPKIES